MASESTPRVVIYGTDWCPHCTSARQLLFRRGIAFEDVDAQERWGDAFRDRLFALAGRLTVPQIVIDGRPIGGWSDLVRLDESGELKRLLAAPAPEVPAAGS